jgi:hypothetical protein
MGIRTRATRMLLGVTLALVLVGLACDSDDEACEGANCGAQTPCNPVTNAPCDAAMGETCASHAAGSVCVENSGQVAGLCEDCSASGACVGGTGCVEGSCFKFCCDDGDCGSGVCQIFEGATYGICQDGADPACDAPLVSPSGGSCL